jgi:7-cyano-7-deazaguanine synthase
MKKTEQQTINLLWTGGLDSTFRLCQLSHYGVTVQPYYIVEERASMNCEIRAMDKIRVLLSTKCHKDFSILPTMYISQDTLAADQAIEHSWNVLHEKYKIGSQYDYLSRVAKQQNIELEIGLENGRTRSKASNAIKSEGVLKSHSYALKNDNTWGGGGNIYN